MKYKLYFSLLSVQLGEFVKCFIAFYKFVILQRDLGILLSALTHLWHLLWVVQKQVVANSNNEAFQP